jgi:hypothetical protein
MWFPVTTTWRVVGLQIRRVSVNILNKQSLAASKGWSVGLGIGRGAKNSLPYGSRLLRNVTQGFGIERIVWNDLDNGKWLYLAQDRDQWRVFVNNEPSVRQEVGNFVTS